MSVKQDGSMVRTAQDLERKYKLAEIQKAYEQSEKTITRINQILQDFVNVVVGTLDNFEGLSDGHITTYFGSGVPSFEWEDSTENHINDLYYDKDTGKAYTFVLKEDVFSWEEVTDKNKIQVLALANATTDAKDGFRRIFVEQPTTPYDNGDLWLKDGVIYACQISKPSTEEYEEHDFIVSSQYDGDTLAIKVGTELEVLRGTVTKVIQDSDFLRVYIDNLDAERRSSIEFLENSLRTLITDANGQSMMEQSADGLTISFSMKSIIETMNANSEKVTELENSTSQTQSDVGKIDEVVRQLQDNTTWIRMGTLDNEACIILGSEDSAFQLVITQTQIKFMEGTQTPAYMTNEAMVIEKANIKDRLQIGTMAWVKRANGHISFMGVRDNG